MIEGNTEFEFEYQYRIRIRRQQQIVMCLYSDVNGFTHIVVTHNNFILKRK